ncbi:glycerate kinase [Thalassococcus sp. S3]|uniref:glycerate kinase type-2 family protein n=1 Tax=Thalassococcus sp. S3 TaxID=2017482 RepID=UPI0010246228|nr:DUF4147 domain-containing protein [Thalassococcus sp. S3]QBF31109.1 MOFRL family protein [Thalassococcus sp. S3]
MTPQEKLTHLWRTGVEAVLGDQAVATALKDETESPDQILAVGKAAAAMARAALSRFPQVPCLVVTKDGHGAGLPDGVEVIEAAHPVPNARSLEGGAALCAAVEEMPEGSQLLLLVSGGASSLAECLRPGLDLPDLAALNDRLLSGGLDIGAMNAERRKISRIKGGGLLSHFKGKHVTVLALSDVPRDEVEVIGSGIGAAPDDPGFSYQCKIVACNAIARDSAARAAEDMGLTVQHNEETLYDSVEALAQSLGPMIREMPVGVAIFGGEPTVTLPPSPGRGGRNQALALALAREIEGRDDLMVLVAGTDGTDGPTEAAGGLVDGAIWTDGAEEALARADSGSYLATRDALFVTGPTGTNVMDLAIVLRA